MVPPMSICTGAVSLVGTAAFGTPVRLGYELGIVSGVNERLVVVAAGSPFSL